MHRRLHQTIPVHLEELWMQVFLHLWCTSELTVELFFFENSYARYPDLGISYVTSAVRPVHLCFLNLPQMIRMYRRGLQLLLLPPPLPPSQKDAQTSLSPHSLLRYRRKSADFDTGVISATILNLLNLFICKIWIISLASQVCCEDQMRQCKWKHFINCKIQNVISVTANGNN